MPVRAAQHVQEECMPHRAMEEMACRGEMQRDIIACDQCGAEYPRKQHLTHQVIYMR